MDVQRIKELLFQLQHEIHLLDQVVDSCEEIASLLGIELPEREEDEEQEEDEELFLPPS